MMNCPWVNDKVVEDLVSKTPTQLTSANFYNTNLATYAARCLHKATQLKSLNLGATKIKGGLIKDLVGELKCLKKLGMKNLNGETGSHIRATLYSKQVIEMGPRMPNITHLDISGCPELYNDIF